MTARRGVARRHADEEAPVDTRRAGSRRGGIFTEPSPTDLGVILGRGPLGERSSKPAHRGWRDRRVRGSVDGERSGGRNTPPRSSDEIDRKPPARRSGPGVVKTQGSSIVRPTGGNSVKAGAACGTEKSRKRETRSLRKRTRHGCSRLKQSMAEADRTHHARGAAVHRKVNLCSAR